jgi:hypothetical protein
VTLHGAHYVIVRARVLWLMLACTMMLRICTETRTQRTCRFANGTLNAGLITDRAFTGAQMLPRNVEHPRMLRKCDIVPVLTLATRASDNARMCWWACLVLQAKLRPDMYG